MLALYACATGSALLRQRLRYSRRRAAPAIPETGTSLGQVRSGLGLESRRSPLRVSSRESRHAMAIRCPGCVERHPGRPALLHWYEPIACSVFNGITALAYYYRRVYGRAIAHCERAWSWIRCRSLACSRGLHMLTRASPNSDQLRRRAFDYLRQCFSAPLLVSFRHDRKGEKAGMSLLNAGKARTEYVARCFRVISAPRGG